MTAENTHGHGTRNILLRDQFLFQQLSVETLLVKSMFCLKPCNLSLPPIGSLMLMSPMLKANVQNLVTKHSFARKRWR